MRMMRSGEWMLAAVIALATTGCGPRSAKEFSGNYAITGKSTNKRTYKSPDSGLNVTEESSSDMSGTMTLNAPDDSTLDLVMGTTANDPTLVFKQDPSVDSRFTLQPSTFMGSGYTFKFDSGSLDFSEALVVGTFAMTGSASYVDSDGVTQTETTVNTSNFSGTKK